MTDHEANSQIILEQKILEKILEKRTIPKSFFQIVSAFEEKFNELNVVENSFPIKDYFGPNIGLAGAKKGLLAANKIKQSWIKPYQTKGGNYKYDIKGLYIFIHDKTPFYVGVSKGIISRIIQHLTGTTHNTSTLAYNIGLLRYEILTGTQFKGKRNEFDFNSNVEPVKRFLLNQKIALMHIENDEELYLFEIFCSMKLQTILNKFETH